MGFDTIEINLVVVVVYVDVVVIGVVDPRNIREFQENSRKL